MSSNNNYQEVTTTTAATDRCVPRNITKVLREGDTRAEVELDSGRTMLLEAGLHPYRHTIGYQSCDVWVKVTNAGESYISFSLQDNSA